MTRLLIVGPPGSGKGTQAEKVSERLGVVTISTGDIFRDNVHGGTSLGAQAKEFLDAGDFVPDEITNNMVRERLTEDDVEHGFILDGYPRTTGQIEYLDRVLAETNTVLHLVLHLVADDEELVSRLLLRAEQSGRSDDTEPVIRHRLDLFHQETEAVISEYSARGLLAHVKATGDVDAVTERLLQAVQSSEATLA